MARFREHFGFSKRTSSQQIAVDLERSSRLIAYAEDFEDRWFWETGPDGHLTYLSSSVAEKIEAFGLQTVGAPLRDVFQIDQSEEERSRSLQFHLMSRTPFSGYPVRGRKGLHENWWSMSGRPRFREDGSFLGFIGSGSDLTVTRKHEALIERLALTDSLTGLANRQRLRDTLEVSLKSSANGSGSIALILLDLDGFKGVNDTLGHPIGDALLVEVARRLTESVGENCIIGRLGGDEFGLIAPANDGRDGLSELSKRVIEAISKPYSVEGNPIVVSCSIGISVAKDDHSTVESLVRDADLALYAAKEGGRATYRFFAEEMLEKARRRKAVEDDLREALNKEQLYLVYQPIVSTSTETLIGFEALLRWRHPTRGTIFPAEFIPLAEECGLIQQIGDWVIRTAIQDLAELPDDLRIAVNVSAVQFSNPALLSTIASAIGRSGIHPGRLELEITESVFLHDQNASRKVFDSLKALGLRLALDDFGTGYSSLAYLQSAPFDKIKIDKTFVRGAIDSRNRNAAIIRAIVALSKSLGMETTAEGVEYQDEIGLIRELGCSQIQGFVYGTGRSMSELLPMLQTGAREVKPIGHKYSRSPRYSFIRAAKFVINDYERDARIRNVSATGVMIDNVELSDQMVGVSVLIELLENQLSLANVRWVGAHGAGLEFQEPIDLKLLNLGMQGAE